MTRAAYDPDSLRRALRPLLVDVGEYSRVALPRQRLRGYQVAPARAIVESVTGGLGRQFAAVFSRQAGKDELLAQVVAFLLTRYQVAGGTIVLGAPTITQANVSRDRLLSRLRRSPLSAGRVRSRDGYIVEVGQASARFLSAAEAASPRGQTASLLLVANEAQDIDPAIWDARFDPMAASTNATTVFMGTVWDRNGLLHRQMEHLAALQARDGVPRVFKVAWPEVAEELPAYGERVRARIAQHGETHPFIRTEYLLEVLDGEGGLFPPQRVAQMAGDHPRRHRAEPGKRYAGLLDVAGEEEEGSGPEAFDNAARRDSTALTIVEVETTGRDLPFYRIVDRMAWTGTKHTALHDQLVDLARNVWGLAALVVDATGVGAGLASFLADRLGRRAGDGGRRVVVEPFVFTGKSKSDLGWAFLGLIDGGRFKEYMETPETEITRVYRHELAACQYEVLPGPGRVLRWSVPADRGHDDLLISAALTARLDGIDWRVRMARGSGVHDSFDEAPQSERREGFERRAGQHRTSRILRKHDNA
jgi:hypothetical protein